jgi:hypothetical protein
MRVDRTSVDEETYLLLSCLGLTPTCYDKMEENIDNFKKILKWASKELDENKEVKLLVFSGYTNPYFWNQIENSLLNALEKGLLFTHCLGPVMAVNEDGSHAIIEACQHYPKNVKIELFPTYYPYHWNVCYSRSRDKKIAFKCNVEVAHLPFSSRRKNFLFSSSDIPSFYKEGYLYSRIQRYEALRPFLKKKKLNEIPKVHEEELYIAYEKKEGKPFMSMNAEEILELLNRL